MYFYELSGITGVMDLKMCLLIISRWLVSSED